MRRDNDWPLRATTEMGFLRTDTGTLSLLARLKSKKLPLSSRVNKGLTAVYVRVPMNLDREMGDSAGGLFHREPAQQ